MKHLFLLLLFTTSHMVSSQTTTNDNVFEKRYMSDLEGSYMNLDGELLIIKIDNTFVRLNSNGILAKGNLSLIDNEIRVIRTDVNQDYNLVYGLTGNTLVITKPKSVQAWLWTRIN